MRKILLFCILIFACLSVRQGFLVSCFAQDKIVAIVNNDAITQKDLGDFVNFMRMQLSQELKEDELENRIESLKSQLLEKLIEDRLILQEAKKNNIRISEGRVKARIDEVRKRYQTEADFQRALIQQGLTLADIELKIKEQLLTYSVIDIKVKSKIIVKPFEVTDFYYKNIEKFKTPEQREVSSMAIDGVALANDLFKQLNRGGDFSDISSKYSLIVNRLRIHRNGELRLEAEEVIFKLKIGEISRPFKINDSFYIFRLDDIIAVRQQTLPEAQEAIYAFLLDKKMQEELERWLTDLKKKSYVKILQD